MCFLSFRCRREMYDFFLSIVNETMHLTLSVKCLISETGFCSMIYTIEKEHCNKQRILLNPAYRKVFGNFEELKRIGQNAR